MQRFSGQYIFYKIAWITLGLVVVVTLWVAAPRAEKSRLGAPWSVDVALAQNPAPYPPSTVITSLTWAPAEEIRRSAHDSDTFPITWGDDNLLYTAFADGFGFDPPVDEKLSLGFAFVTGDPDNYAGSNIRSEAEQRGDGAGGMKASGLLMVDGTLYMWMRNANLNGQECKLAWSTDGARTWTFSDWNFAEFGYCTFINYGRNYEGAPDAYVYSVSPDSPSAYDPSDGFVLFRAPKAELSNRNAYQYYAGLDDVGNPIWTIDIEERDYTFYHPDSALRSGISYNAALGRYIWWQQIPEPDEDTRFEGGFGVYDAPQPWGPWTTVYFTNAWDVGPGETGSFPPKWMSPDGLTMNLVFSGEDSFSVRKATLTAQRPPTLPDVVAEEQTQPPPEQPPVPQPEAPQPEVPQPEVPQPEAPQPEAPQPTAPQPEAPVADPNQPPAQFESPLPGQGELPVENQTGSAASNPFDQPQSPLPTPIEAPPQLPPPADQPATDTLTTALTMTAPLSSTDVASTNIAPTDLLTQTQLPPPTEPLTENETLSVTNHALSAESIALAAPAVQLPAAPAQVDPFGFLFSREMAIMGMLCLIFFAVMGLGFGALMVNVLYIRSRRQRGF